MADSKFMPTSRRAVGGLISLIALIIVFGIASLAFLEINTTHADFVLNSITVNEKQFGKIKEQLNFTVTNSSTNYTVDVANLWNDQSTLESYLAKNSNDKISVQRYLNETTVPLKQNIIDIQDESTLIFDDTNSTHGDTTIIFMTLNGNKCTIPIPDTEGDKFNRLC